MKIAPVVGWGSIPPILGSPRLVEPHPTTFLSCTQNGEYHVTGSTIAQEVESVLPEIVKTDDDGYKAVSYEKMTPVLVEAIKELKKIVEAQQTRIEHLESAIAEVN